MIRCAKCAKPISHNEFVGGLCFDCGALLDWKESEHAKRT